MFDYTGNKIMKYISLVVMVLFTLSLIVVFSVTSDVFNENLEAGTDEDGIAVPIVMYHSIMKSSREMGKYVITPTEFSDDLLYLKSHGYNSITMTELINYVYYNARLPAKPVILTFDDGNLNNYTYGRPSLQKYGMKAVISVVGEYSEAFSSETPPTRDSDYAFVSWEQIKEISNSGYFEIQNHTYHLHSLNKGRYGIKRKSGESLESYCSMLSSDIGKLQDKLFEVTGIKPNTFAYPFGYANKESVDVLRQLGFKASLSCVEGVNIISRSNPDILFGLKRNNRPHGISSENFFRKICP